MLRLPYAEPAYLSGLLTGAAHAVERARERQSVHVVWTGPESGVSSSRLTAAAVIELINAARYEILLVSYATHTEPLISTALSDSVARGVTVTLLAERHADNSSYGADSAAFPSLHALRLRWPALSRPPGASLHAKIIVVDDQIALVGSANLTSRAMESNLECGILIRGGPQPRAIRDHITGLYTAGSLCRLLRSVSELTLGILGTGGKAKQARTMTYYEAALQVLRSVQRPLTTREITKLALTQGLITPSGKTPEATMAAELYLRVGKDPQLIKLEERGEVRAKWGSVRWTVCQWLDGQEALPDT